MPHLVLQTRLVIREVLGVDGELTALRVQFRVAHIKEDCVVWNKVNLQVDTLSQLMYECREVGIGRLLVNAFRCFA